MAGGQGLTSDARARAVLARAVRVPAVLAVSVLALLPAIRAPAATAAAGGGERVPFTFAPTRAQLVLIPGSEASQALAEHRPGGINAASPAETELLRDCAAGESPRAQVSKGFLWSITTQAWRILLHPLAVSVHDELLKYANVSSASASGDYYRGTGASGPSAQLESRMSCLRFTRFVTAGAGGDEVALDFVASMRLDSAHDAIRLRPLRLYINQAGAKSADGHYSVAVSVRADAVWRDEFAGHRSQVFDATVATESVDLKSGSFLKYYPLDAGSGTREPIVPVSFGVDRSQDFGRAEFVVSVAELGTPSQTLTLLSEMLPDPDEKLSKLVVAAALARVGMQ